MKKILIILVFLTALNAEITTKDVKYWDFSNKQYVLLDVRTTQECIKSGVIKGSVSIPVFNIDGSYNSNFVKEVEKVFNKKDKIAIICRSGARSVMAAKILEKAGFKHLVSLSGGMLELPDDAATIIPYKN